MAFKLKIIPAEYLINLDEKIDEFITRPEWNRLNEWMWRDLSGHLTNQGFSNELLTEYALEIHFRAAEKYVKLNGIFE